MTEARPRRPKPEAASLQRLLAALAAAGDGDFSVRLPGSADPLLDDIGAAFNSLAARLSERAAARERFLPTLSHELRTPLNSMLVLARLLSVNPEGNLTREQVEYASVIHSAGTDLLEVISGLLDTSGHASGDSSGGSSGDSSGHASGHSSGQGDPARHDAGQRLLVVEAARGGMLTLLAHGAVSGLPDAGGRVEVLTAVTVEEVADALEAGPPHCVVLDLGAGDELTAAALRSFSGSRRVPCVPVLAHTRDELTAKRFGFDDERAELIRSPRDLRERIAWHLSAAAVPAVAGSSVAAASGAAASGASGNGHAALRGKKVLVVDDDPRNVFAVASTLEYYGMTVLRSADGRAGIDRLLSEPDTDLVLMDLMMPGMDGYAAISEIREMPEFSDLPIIVVTAHTLTGELATRVPGADDCLTKPLDTEELLGRMVRCLAS